MHKERLGEVCPDCGTHHRIIESLPARPVTRSALDRIMESDRFVFAEGVMWMSPDMLGVDGEKEVTDGIVLGTTSSAMVLQLYEDEGWMVEIEEEPGDDEAPEERALDMWRRASNMASEAFHDVFG